MHHRLAALAILALLAAPLAAAGVEEFPLPAGYAAPVAVATDASGDVWVTLDGTWAIAHLPLDGSAPRVWRLQGAPVDEFDSLYGIALEGGAVFTASREALHHKPAGSDSIERVPFTGAVEIVGGLRASGAAVYVGFPVEDDIGSYLRDAERFVRFDVPRPQSGPLEFAQAPDRLDYFSATYGNTYGWIERDGSVRLGPANIVQAPTGIATDAQGNLWLGEHGGSAVVKVDPRTNATARYPTAPSPYYPISGPSGVAVDDQGVVWTVLHFADRVARLDVANNTIVEYEYASSPVTNAQHLALAKDGGVWVGLREKDRLAHVRYGGETPSFAAPDRVVARPGSTVRVPIEGARGDFVAESGVQGLKATMDGDTLVLDATAAPLGEHRVVVSERVTPKLWVGRHVLVAVEKEETADTPAPPIAAALVLVALAALARRRRAA